ncbi:MAG: glucose-6-phosphate dehydrogenase (NADP(+)), partial [Acholeplasmataceae bacterium]|nr:glucose-6-phosphate dehydrogenase (NADP(+)) [Acholeplasmataceae bacterium]
RLSKVVAVGRRSFDTAAYLDYVTKNAPETPDIETLKDMVDYVRTDIGHVDDFMRLKEHLSAMSGPKTVTLYYFAVSPSLFPVIAGNIHQVGLVQKGDQQARIIFEKPFGNSLLSATAINDALYEAFDEHQIYRIDHYLGKEMIQNLLTVRFANRIFEDVWHNRTIKNVKIIVKETDGVLNRGAYYDDAGALSDMIQSHLLQMLSLVAMDTPMSYHSTDVKKEKIKVLEHIAFEPKQSLFGQYAGYIKEHDVAPESKTETFVFLKALVNTPRFKGVPFYLMTGKRLEVKQSMIIIEFEETNEQRKWKLPLSTNKLIIKIAPLDGVGLMLNSKVPGLKDAVHEVELEYCVACQAVGNMPEAYEKLLLDAFFGHKSLFADWCEIERSWRFVDSIRKTSYDLMIYDHYDALYEQITKLTGEVM